MTKNNKDDKKVPKRKTKKNSGRAEKENKNVQSNVVEGEIINDDTNLINLKNKTTLKNIIKEDGQIYAKTALGQNRDLDTTNLVKVDEDWLPKLLNLEGAGEKYKNIGENELKFIINIIKYNNNTIAYKQSYDCTNLSKDYIEQRSSELKRRRDVSELLAILRERMVTQTEKQLQWQFSDSVNSLKYLIDTAMEEVENARNEGKSSFLTLTRVTAIKDAVKELNQMMGYTDKSVKINQSVTIIGKEEDLMD